MSMLPRLDRAIDKIQKQISGVPLDERVDGNKDYTKYVNLLASLRQFRTAVQRMEEMLDKLEV